MRDQAEKLRQMVKDPGYAFRTQGVRQDVSRVRVITVTSGKGGVGKTNFTVNLALAFAGLGKKVLLIDADLGMANVNVVLGCLAPYSFLNLLEDKVDIHDVITEGPRGIKFLSGGSGIYRLADLNDSQLQQVINKILLFDNWADIILIDTGAGINRNVLNFVVAADEVVIITTPEPTAITDAYAMMKAYAGYRGSAPLQLVVNRVLEQAEGQMVVDKLVKVALHFLGLPVSSLGFVYEDRSILNAVKSQNPLLLAYPQSVSARCIEGIARQMLQIGSECQTRGFKGFLDRFLKCRW